MLTYQQTLDYIYSFANFETRAGRPVGPGDFSLDRIRRLLDRLGNPQERYPSVHVAGTKGKGSTAAMVASVLQAAGFQVGLFTSPHLHTYRERIQIDGQIIPAPELIDLVEQLRPALDADPALTTFEVTTALAFEHFVRKQVDWAVFEVGLGGRLDATNVITPRISLLTPLSLEHTAILGKTLTRIAWEKAGIIKPGVPAVTSPQPPEALSLIAAVARERGAPLAVAGRDWTWRRLEFNLDGQTFEVAHRPQVLEPTAESAHYWIPLLGWHQVINATTAVAALDVLRGQGVPISEAAIATGLAQVHWPGRLEILARQPTVVVDGAHNVESLDHLAGSLAELFPDRRYIIVFGTSGSSGITSGKDLAGIIRRVQSIADHLILVRSRHPRAADPLALLELTQNSPAHVHIGGDVAAGLSQALDLAGGEDLICVTGSLYVVAEARESWFEYLNLPLPERDPESHQPSAISRQLFTDR